MRYPFIIFTLLLSISCRPKEGHLTTDPTPQLNEIEPITIQQDIVIPDGAFVLKSINGTPYQNTPITLNITSGRVSGKAPVNRYSAELNNGIVQPIAVTRMAGPPELMQLEHEFLTLLQDATINVTTKGSIVARKNETTILMFQPATP